MGLTNIAFVTDDETTISAHFGRAAYAAGRLSDRPERVH